MSRQSAGRLQLADFGRLQLQGLAGSQAQRQSASLESIIFQQLTAVPGQVASQKLRLTNKEQFFIEKQRNASEDQRKSAPWLFGKFCVRLEQMERGECRALLLFEILHLN